MTTYGPTRTTLAQRLARANLVLVAAGLREVEVAEDPLGRGKRAIGTFAVDVEEVLAGDPGDGPLLVRLIGDVEGERIAWNVDPDGGRAVLLLQAETAPGATTYVPYESSVFRLRKDRIVLPDDVPDDEGDGRAPTLASIAERWRRESERRAKEERLAAETDPWRAAFEAPVREVPGGEIAGRPAEVADPPKRPEQPPAKAPGRRRTRGA